MIFSDGDIVMAMARKDIQIQPFHGANQLQPASVELAIAEQIDLEPDEFALSHTIEVVTLSGAVAAQLNGKSSWARLGLLVHSTGGWIDPGFSGQIVLELKNISASPIAIHKGRRVAQLVFHPLSSTAIRSYGHPDLASHYQNQRGNTRSHLETDA